MGYEVKVYDDGEELQVSEVDLVDSTDPDSICLTVYAWRNN